MTMENKGFWIKFYQSFTEWRWYHDEMVKSLYIHCLLKAYVKDFEIGGEIFERGTFITSTLKLADELGTTRQKIRTALEKLVSTNEITIKSTNKKTVIKVVNYTIYQDKENKNNQQNNQQPNHQITNKQPTDNQQITTDLDNIYNNIYKKEREKDIKEIVLVNTNTSKKVETPKKTRNFFVPPTLEEIEKYCRERKNNVDPNQFYDYFTTGEWFDSKGQKVKNWKQKIITWEKHNIGTARNNIKNGKPDVKPDWLEDYVKEQEGGK